MKDLQYMEKVNEGVFKIIEREDALDDRIAKYISVRSFRSDDKLLIRYSKRHRLYNPPLKERTIYVIEKLQAHLRKDYNIFATMSEDEDSIFIVAVRTPDAPIKKERERKRGKNNKNKTYRWQSK